MATQIEESPEYQDAQLVMDEIAKMDWGIYPSFSIYNARTDEWSAEFAVDKAVTDSFNGFSADVPSYFHGIFADLPALNEFRDELLAIEDLPEADRVPEFDAIVEKLKDEYDTNLQVGRGSWITGQVIREHHAAKRAREEASEK